MEVIRRNKRQAMVGVRPLQPGRIGPADMAMTSTDQA